LNTKEKSQLCQDTIFKKMQTSVKKPLMIRGYMTCKTPPRHLLHNTTVNQCVNGKYINTSSSYLPLYKRSPGIWPAFLKPNDS
ncbi:MAG: hypothetical protein UT26_C0029G0001, partial [Microgenomates group bacterium GW2011_GWC1_39_12]